MNRLGMEAPHGWHGEAIDRTRPLRFRLDGKMIEAFAGDTVLSAALVSGMTSAGPQGAHPLALEERYAPLIRVVTRTGDGLVLPMARVPVTDGASFTTVPLPRHSGAPEGWFARLRHGLGIGRTSTAASAAPRLPDAVHERQIEADLVVIGAGVAGLSAAAAAVAAGKHVVLVERALSFGGAAVFFGTTDGEEPPEVLVARLGEKLEGRGRCTRLLGTEARRIASGTVECHLIQAENGALDAARVIVSAPRIILATGAFERLPIFAGNRTPGVVGALAAWQRARRYGLWLGKSAVFSTPHSHSYRLALHAVDAGVAVQRIVDTRIHPQSRFIDFCKATGMTLGSGLMPSSVERTDDRPPKLRVSFAVSIGDLVQDGATVETDCLVAAGGWQPDLALWLMAGGATRWSDPLQALVAANAVDGVTLAGAAAGYVSTQAAADSGRAAALAAMGKPAPAVEDRQIPVEFESPDAPSPVAPQRPGQTGPAYLDRGHSLITRRSAVASGFGIANLNMQSSVLDLGDVAATVALGLVAGESAGRVAAERCMPATELEDTGWRPMFAVPDATPLPRPPAYLAGRFGPKPLICVIAVGDSRYLEPGCLIFASSSAKRPEDAIGVVFSAAPGGRSGGLALMGKVPDRPDVNVYVRDGLGVLAARVLDRLKG